MGSNVSAFASFIPLLIVMALFGAFSWPIIKRKGFGAGTLVLCLIPFVQYFALIWVASKTDKDVLDRLARLEQ